MPNLSRGYVLREGEHTAAVRPARLSSDLTKTSFVTAGAADPRLVDPLLEAVVERAAMEARARGFRAGHAAGYEAGRQEGLALLEEQRRVLAEMDEEERHERRARVLGLVQQVQLAVGEALAVRQPTLDDLYGTIVDMAVELAESLVGHHLTVGDCGARDALLRALHEAPERVRLTLRLNPADAESAAGVLSRLSDREVGEIVPDPRVERGGAVVEAENLVIDAQLGPAFERVRAVVRP